MVDKPKKHIFVCSSARLNGEIKGVCAQKEGVDIARALIEEVQDRGIDGDVMVTTTGCFGICGNGPVVMVYPEQTWYGKVTVDDVEDILDGVEEDAKVERLLI